MLRHRAPGGVAAHRAPGGEGVLAAERPGEACGRCSVQNALGSQAQSAPAAACALGFLLKVQNALESQAQSAPAAACALVFLQDKMLCCRSASSVAGGDACAVRSIYNRRVSAEGNLLRCDKGGEASPLRNCKGREAKQCLVIITGGRDGPVALAERCSSGPHSPASQSTLGAREHRVPISVGFPRAAALREPLRLRLFLGIPDFLQQ